MWYFNKTYYLYTLLAGCCTIRELMGKFEDGSWTYAIIQHKDGKTSLVCEWKDGVMI